MEKETDRKNKTEYKRLIIGILVILVIAGGFIFYLSWPLLTGTTVILDTRPVDPFDPLRGQYMTINYEIGTVEFEGDIRQGDKIYVILKPDENNIWRLEKATLTKPQHGTFIRGTVTRVRGNSTNIKYGIEQFFFERDADVPTRDITVEAKVDSSGKARLVNLLQNGEPVQIEYKKARLTS